MAASRKNPASSKDAPRDPNDTPMMRQFRAAKERYPRHLLFFRMGDFYELFFDDAKVVSRVLGLTLTARSKGPDAIPMAGVPYHSAEQYLGRLLRQGFSVAICDQTEDAKQAKGLVKRDITRVVTPGTVVEDEMLDARVPNRLVAVLPLPGQNGSDKHYGVASVDLAGGQIFVRETTSLTALADELTRLGPSECLLPEPEPLPAGARPVPVLPPQSEGKFAVSYTRVDAFDETHALTRLIERFATRKSEKNLLQKLGKALPAGCRAAGALVGYIEEMHAGAVGHLRAPTPLDPDAYLELDEVAIRSLELVETLRDRKYEGSLLWTIDRTKTGAGARCLREWMLRPLRGLDPLKARQDAVGTLVSDMDLRDEVRTHLGEMADLERIAARLATGRASPRDLVALKNSLRLLPQFEASLEGLSGEVLAGVRTRLGGLAPAADQIEATLKDDCPNSVTEGGLINDGLHEDLDRLREVASGGKKWIMQFQVREQERAGFPIKIGYNRVFGYYIEITRTHSDKVPADYERRQTLTNAERYITPELKERESEVLGAEEKIGALEQRLFNELREAVAAYIPLMQAAGAALAELDALAGLAEVATRKGHVKPDLSNGRRLSLSQMRHPVLEESLAKGETVPNDLLIDATRTRTEPKKNGVSPQIMLLTGPNMAGKSTYIRCTALCTVLAQMGAYVPAEKAEVGLVDRIFTRVGAADDLFGGRSTFMVEMAEVAEILQHTSDKSLVILDEVGRGTSTYDGVSLAWAIIERLHDGPARPRTLFATHYHELAGLEEELPRVQNASAVVKEWQGEITFLYRIAPGPSERSFGLHVARLAGCPKEVIARARSILLELEEEAAVRVANINTPTGQKRRRRRKPTEDDGQMLLFEPTAQEIDPRVKAMLDDLRTLDPHSLTPLEALTLLDTLAKRARGEES